MKKILVLASAIVMVAAFAQASAVNWKLSGDDVKGKAYYAYNGDQAALIASLQDGSMTDEELASFGGTDHGATKTGTVASRGTSDKFGDAAGTITFIVFDGTPANGGTFKYASASTSGKTYDPPNQAPGSVDISSWSTGTFKSAQPVPEPCSVALIALGLAAFGMKRKVA